MQYNLLLPICSGAKNTRRVYVEGGADVLCDFGCSLNVVSEVLPAKEAVTKRTETHTVALKHRTRSAWTSFANLATYIMPRQCVPVKAMVMGKLPLR